MIDFENPAAFFLLLLIPMYYFLKHMKLFTKISFPLTLSDWNGLSFSWNKRFYKFISTVAKFFLICGFVFLIVAYASPVVHHQEKVYTSRGADILFVIDTSPSMAAKGIAGGTRLDAAKQAIHALAQDDSGDAFGLVEMARDSAVIVPPTLDRLSFFNRLDNLVVGEMGDGTAIGNGLSCAVYHLSKSTAVRKCIVLITDGENNAGSVHPYTAARLAHAKDISLYVLGVGTKGTVPLEYVDPKTGHLYSGYLKSEYDAAALSQLASEADGRFFGVDTMASLSQTLTTIGKHEAVIQSYHIRSHDENFYSQMLVAAAVCFVLAWFLRRLYLKELL